MTLEHECHVLALATPTHLRKAWLTEFRAINLEFAAAGEPPLTALSTDVAKIFGHVLDEGGCVNMATKYGFELLTENDTWDASRCGAQDRSNTFDTAEQAQAELPRLAEVLGIDPERLRVAEIEVGDEPVTLWTRLQAESARLNEQRAQAIADGDQAEERRVHERGLQVRIALADLQSAAGIRAAMARTTQPEPPRAPQLEAAFDAAIAAIRENRSNAGPTEIAEAVQRLTRHFYPERFKE